MSQYKELITNLVEDVAAADLGKASRTFKSIMASKLMEGLANHSLVVQNNISEAYPEIFDSPVDVKAATDVSQDVEQYPEDSEDDLIEPEQGKSEADYKKGEDEEVYEQVVYEEKDDDLEEEDDEELEESGFNAAAAEAAANDEKEFEFPPGSGKMHPVTMDKDTANEIDN